MSVCKHYYDIHKSMYINEVSTTQEEIYRLSDVYIYSLVTILLCSKCNVRKFVFKGEFRLFFKSVSE